MPIGRRTVIARRILLAAIAAAGFGAAELSPGHAQSYPSKPIKLVLPYTPGSPNDVLARLVAPGLSSRLGQPLVVDNRPGGGTSIGTKAAMGAEPDGYTLLFSNSPTLLIVPLAHKSFTYDPLTDFVAIAMVASSANVMVIAPSVPAKSVQEFVAYAKANPGKLNFGFGQGTQPHLVGEMFKVATGTDIASIPYRGGAQAITDVLGGRIHMNIGTVATLAPLIRDGRLKALAITSTTRSPDLPDVPTMAEAGYPAVTSVSYYGILGPAGLAADVVRKLNGDVNESLKSAELTASMANLGFEPVSGSPQDFAALLATETQKWAPVVKATGFQME
jgi:tripartite-type tricarboxylate transporter receptor subunit TctC